MDKIEFKKIWDDSDFNDMGWHDCTIWAIGSNPDASMLSIDLDYIFKWVDPAPGERNYKFWVSPVTMIFENVRDVKIELDYGPGTFEISELSRADPQQSPVAGSIDFAFHFECQEGSIKFRANGFKMHVRRDPILIGQQRLNFLDRNGFYLAVPTSG